jgi:predicted metalloendopeptidase
VTLPWDSKLYQTGVTLSTDIETANWEFYGKTLTGALKQRPRHEKALQVVNVSAAATLTLNAEYSDYVFSGTTTTWTLPPLVGYKNVKYFIKNREI